jgi:multicomponent Na+:H+ antiporter subunit C
VLKFLVTALFAVGLWGILSGRNLIRKIIGLSLLNSSVVLLFIIGGRVDGRGAPIITGSLAGQIVDPIPQALMLTAIVVGLSVTAVALILSVKLYRLYGSLDVEEIERQSDESDY